MFYAPNILQCQKLQKKVKGLFNIRFGEKKIYKIQF